MKTITRCSIAAIFLALALPVGTAHAQGQVAGIPSIREGGCVLTPKDIERMLKEAKRDTDRIIREMLERATRPPRFGKPRK